MLFQVHLWSGIALGLYVLLMSTTGSVLVYSNELYRAATPPPIFSKNPGARLTDGQLSDAALRSYPGYVISRIMRARNRDQAVDVWLRRGEEIQYRLFDPRSGVDLGPSVPGGIRRVSQLIDLHDNLFAGETGRTVNGAGALATLVLTLTGLAIWWPGIKMWRRSLALRPGLGANRLIWNLHSVIGFWSFGFILLFVVSGVYLCFPEIFQGVADRLEPPTTANQGFRVGDGVIYWLAFLHFGRVDGIGIPCNGPGVCDQTTKAIWALFGLAPASMFVTGAMMWWNRVLQPRVRSVRRPSTDEPK
jgi:uncharacterized iron-regulated membrane protein